MQRSASQPRHGLRRLGQACLFQQRVMRPQADSPKGSLPNDLRQPDPSFAHHLPTDTSKIDSDLAAVVEAWPDLPEVLKAGIVAMVKAAFLRHPTPG